jgi:hypothetical protein
VHSLTKLKLVIDAQSFEANLLTEDAPKTCEAFLKSLPIQTTTYHSAWSGDSIFFILQPDKTPIIPREENTSIYGAQGEIMWHPAPNYQEFQIVHGIAQFRWKTGPLKSNIFARIESDLKSFDLLGRRIQKEGGKALSIQAVG